MGNQRKPGISRNYLDNINIRLWLRGAIVIWTLILAAGVGTIGCSNRNGTGDFVLFGMSDRGGPAAGVTVTSQNGSALVASCGGILTYNVVLTSQPNANVTLPVSIDNLSFASISPTSLTFTHDNWNIPQTVQVTGGCGFSGNQQVTLTLGPVASTDPGYSGKTIPSIPLTLLDTSSYGITVSPTYLLNAETANNPSGILNTATFYVALNKAPAANVVIPNIVSANTTTGSTVDQSSLTFTPSNWSTPQAVNVTAVADGQADGNQTFLVNIGNSQSSDPNYNNLVLGPVTVTTYDDPTNPNVVVTPPSINLVEATPTECSSNAWGNCSGTIQVYLTKAPTCSTGNVIVKITASGGSTGRVTVNTSPLTFTNANYSTPQTVTITTVDDSVDNSGIPVTLTVAVDSLNTNSSCGYSTQSSTVTVNIDDNDGYGIRVSNMNRVTTETTWADTSVCVAGVAATAGQNGTFQVKLNKAPATGKTVTIPISDTFDIKNYGHHEGTVDKSSLTFNDSNWGVAQTVTVTPQNDCVQDGDIQYVIGLTAVSSSDPNYNGKDPRDVTVINMNKDTAGIVSPTSSTGHATDDMGNLGSTYATFSLRLNSKPTANVTLNLANNNTSHGTLDTSSLVFTPSNWNAVQTFHVTGKSDSANNGNLTYNVSVGSISSTDSTYTGVSKPSYSIYSCDNDLNNLIVGCQLSGMGTHTTEGGGKAYFWLITQSVPLSTITANLLSDDLTEGTIGTPVTIDSSNYNVLSSSNTNYVTATGVDDTIFDGNITYHAYVNTATGGLTINTGNTLARYTLVNDDNEVRYVSSVTGHTTETAVGSGGTTATINVRLGATPASAVTMTVACGSDLTECASVSPSTLTFDSSNWSTDQYVTVTGKDDNIADGNINYSVAFTVASSDTVFNGQNFSVTVSNWDNENPAKAVWVTNSTFTGEFGGTALAAADGLCNGSDTHKPTNLSGASYKAFLVDGANRIATTTGTNATGQSGWVLIPNTQYYLWTSSSSGIKDSGSTYIFTANANGLIDWTTTFNYDGYGSVTGLGRAFTTSAADQFWTGMNSDMTTATAMSGAQPNCQGWQYVNDQNSPFGAFYGQFGVGNSTSQTAISSGNQLCTVASKIICVQQ